MTAHPGENADAVLARLPPGIGGGLFFFHVDLTDTTQCPRDRSSLCTALRARYSVPVNAAVTSISKRHVQAICARAGLAQTLATREGDPVDRLIIKTDRNYGGEPEMRLDTETRARLGVRASVVSHDGHGYRVLRRAEITENEWDDPALVVERYVDNAEHAFYRAFIMGTRIVLLEGRADQAVRTISRSSHRRRFFFDTRDRDRESTRSCAEAARAIATFCDAFALDFGCLDLVRDDDGVFYVIDVNPTPWWTRNETGLEDHLIGGLAGLRTRGSLGG